MNGSYRYLDDGEKIQKNDEYTSGMGVWRLVPNFLVGSKAQDRSSKLRRTIPVPESNTTKKKLFSFLFGK